MLGIIVVLLAILAAGTAHSSQKLTPATYATAQAKADESARQQAAQLADCVQAQAAGQVPVNSPYFLPPGMTCQDYVGVDKPQARWFLPNTWVFADSATNMLLIFGVLFALFGFAVGASYVGAEWSSGGMANLLLWRPRRIALLGGKLGALLLSVLASGLVFVVLWVLMLCGIAEFRGSFGHITSGLVTSMALATSRSLALGLVVAAIGFAIASIGRNTASALGIIVGYIVVFEAGGFAVARLLNIARPERFLLSRYVAAWLYQSQTYYSNQTCTFPLGNGVSECRQTDWHMRMGSAAEVIGILAAALLAWAFISMRRRDVT
jgi:ABC-type transport system involved in multi-copper enzyme maturation permease subunit